MRGDQLARQWRISRTIESKKQGTTLAELASQEDCSPRTVWRDAADLHVVDPSFYIETRIEKRNLKARWGRITVEPGGLVEVMSWVTGLGRHAEVLEPAHLRQALAKEFVVSAEKYADKPVHMSQEGSKQTPPRVKT